MCDLCWNRTHVSQLNCCKHLHWFQNEYNKICNCSIVNNPKLLEDTNTITTLPCRIFSQNISINLFLSGLDCSCQNPIACISSCSTVPWERQPGPRDSPWYPGECLFPTVDQQLEKKSTNALFALQMQHNNMSQCLFWIFCAYFFARIATLHET